MARQGARPPADPSEGPVAQFGFDLRQLRQKKGYSYAELARRTYYSRAALHAADHGYQLATEEIVRAYVGVCEGDVHAFVDQRQAIAELREAAQACDVGLRRKPREERPVPDPTTCVDIPLYVDGLKLLREWSGLSYNAINKITVERDYHPRLPQSSWHRATNGGDPKKLPTKPTVTSFLAAIDLSEDQQQLWLDQWSAVYNGYAKRPPRPAWAALATAGHQIVRGQSAQVTPMETIRDWTRNEHGQWVEIRQETAPGSSLWRPQPALRSRAAWLAVLFVLLVAVL